MASTHPSHRRKNTHHTSRLAIGGAVIGVIGVVAIATALVVVLRSGASHSGAQEPVGATSSHSAHMKTGQTLDMSTPDGYAYRMGAVDGGSSGRTKTGKTSGSAAYIDYMLTNTLSTPALLDFPGDLFVKRNMVAVGVPCQPETGAPADTCSVRNHSQVIDNLGSPAPVSKNGDQYLAGNSSYLIRITTDPVLTVVPAQSDLALYVWNERFVSSGQATLVPFP